MLLQFPLLRPTTAASRRLSRDRFSAGRSRHRRLKVVFSLGGGKWKLNDLDRGELTGHKSTHSLTKWFLTLFPLLNLSQIEVVQERLSSWLLKAQTLISEVAAPLMKPGQANKMAIEHQLEDIAVKEEVFMASELTVERRTPYGNLSLAAVVSIEQFGR